MLMSVVFAGIATMIIFGIIENIKKEISLYYIGKINEKMKEYIENNLGEIKIFDVFLVKKLRESLHGDFMKKQGIHEFELMMTDSRHLKMSYKINGERREFEISTELDKIEIREIGWFSEIEEMI